MTNKFKTGTSKTYPFGWKKGRKQSPSLGVFLHRDPLAVGTGGGKARRIKYDPKGSPLWMAQVKRDH
jgi:hypothetical protein